MSIKKKNKKSPKIEGFRGKGVLTLKNIVISGSYRRNFIPSKISKTL
jgi:hypothetical protein